MAQFNSLLVTGDSRFLNKINGDISGDAHTIDSHGVPASGNASNTQIVLGNDTRLTNSRTPTSHTHGNITNAGALQTTDITIASGDKLIVTDSSNNNIITRTSVTFDGSTTTKALTPKGTFETFINDVSDKMDKVDPTGSGSLSINRKANTTIGASSVAIGLYCEASGDISYAEGCDTVANTEGSHAEGDNTIAGSATIDNIEYTGEYAHAEGSFTLAVGDHSHAEGHTSKAIGNYSHAECSSTSSGNYSHAEGASDAIGNYSHAEGGFTEASGDYSHSECSSTRASGDSSHAEGNGTEASGNCSHAEGVDTTASGEKSHAEGWNTEASGNNSHAEGLGTIASGDEQHVSGKYNIADAGNYAEIIGNGNDSTTRSNARTLDWNGNEEIAGNLRFMESSNTGSTIPGIMWKEDGYGDKFEIRPRFAGAGDSNFLGIDAATGGAGTDPQVSTVLEIHPSGGEILYGPAPTRNFKSTTIDMSKADNNVSSNTYIGSYYQDMASRSFGKITPVVLPGGASILEMYAQNFNTSGVSVGSNTMQLSMDKSGNAGAYFSHPWALLEALGQYGGMKTGYIVWKNNCFIRQCGGDWSCFMLVDNSLYSICGGGGNHATMTPTLKLLAGDNMNVTQSITHSTNYSDFKYTSTSNHRWAVLSFSNNHNNHGIYYS